MWSCEHRALSNLLPFYQNVLGFELTQREDGSRFAQLRAGAAIVDMLEHRGTPTDDPESPARKNERNMDHFALRLESFDEEALRQHLVSIWESMRASCGETTGRRGTTRFTYRTPRATKSNLRGGRSLRTATPDHCDLNGGN